MHGLSDDQIRKSAMLLESIVIGHMAGVGIEIVQRRVASGEATAEDVAAILQMIEHPDAVARTLPLKDIPTLKIPGMPSYAELLDLCENSGIIGGGLDIFGSIQTPALITNGWYDSHGGSWVFRMLRDKGGSQAAREDTRWVVGPWSHGHVSSHLGEVGYGALSSAVGAGTAESHLAFFDRYLKGDESALDLPRVRLFIMGANEWREADDWPPPGTEERRWHLHSGGAANGSNGDGVLSRAYPAVGSAPDSYD